MWIRVIRRKEQKEILFDTDKIWKIEVSYLRPPADDGPIYVKTTLEEAKTNERVIPPLTAK